MTTRRPARGRLFIRSYTTETETHSIDSDVYETPTGYSVESTVINNRGRDAHYFRHFKTWERCETYIQSLSNATRTQLENMTGDEVNT